MPSMMLSAVDAKHAVKGAASKAAAGAQRMAGLEPKQGTHMLPYSSPSASCTLHTVSHQHHKDLTVLAF